MSRRLVLVPLACLCAFLLGALAGIEADLDDAGGAAPAPNRSSRSARSTDHVVSMGVAPARSSTSPIRVSDRVTRRVAGRGLLGDVMVSSDKAGSHLARSMTSMGPTPTEPPFGSGGVTPSDGTFRSGATLGNIALPLCIALGDCSAEGNAGSGAVGRGGRSGLVAGNVPAPLCVTVAGECRAQAEAGSGDTGPDGRSGDTLGNVPLATCVTVSGRCSSSSSAQPGSPGTRGRAGASLANVQTAVCVTVTGQCRTRAGTHRGQGPHREGLNVELPLCLALPGHCEH